MKGFLSAMRATGLAVALAAITTVHASPDANARASDHPSPAKLARQTCVGIKVERCVWLRWDEVNQKLRGWADIRDRQGNDGDWHVKVTNIRLIRNGNVVATSSDGDDWHADVDHGYTSTVDCRDGNWVVAAEMWWWNMETGDKSANTLKFEPAEYVDCP